MFNRPIDSDYESKGNKKSLVLIFTAFLVMIFSGIIVYTELAYPFNSIKTAFLQSPKDMSNVNWYILMIDYRTSLIGSVFCLLGGILLIFESRFGWILSLGIILSYLIIYLLEFMFNILNQDTSSSLFLILMICLLFFTSLILFYRRIRSKMKIGNKELISTLIIMIIFLHQYYR